MRFEFRRKEPANGGVQKSPAPSETTKVLSAKASDSRVSELEIVSSFKSTIERIKALESERKSLLLEIEELKRMADAKAKALESEIDMLRDEVKSLRVLLSGEEDVDFGARKKK